MGFKFKQNSIIYFTINWIVFYVSTLKTQMFVFSQEIAQPPRSEMSFERIRERGPKILSGARTRVGRF